MSAVAEGMVVGAISLPSVAKSSAIFPAPPQPAGSTAAGLVTVPPSVVMVHTASGSMSCAVVSVNVMAASASPEAATAVVNPGVPVPQPLTDGAAVPNR